jgi:hypothetical protein
LNAFYRLNLLFIMNKKRYMMNREKRGNPL